MKITVRVKFEKGKERIKELGENNYNAYLKSPPKQGKANEELLEMLAIYFKKEVKNVKIVSGKSERKKIVLIK